MNVSLIIGYIKEIADELKREHLETSNRPIVKIPKVMTQRDKTLNKLKQAIIKLEEAEKLVKEALR